MLIWFLCLCFKFLQFLYWSEIFLKILCCLYGSLLFIMWNLIHHCIWMKRLLFIIVDVIVCTFFWKQLVWTLMDLCWLFYIYSFFVSQFKSITLVKSISDVRWTKYRILFHVPLVDDFMLELVNEIRKSVFCGLNLLWCRGRTN